MATTNYSWNLPTVGGSEDTWGTQLNSNWSDLDTLLGGTNATEFAILDGATVTTVEVNYLSGVTSGVQTQFNTLSGRTISAGGGLTGGGDLSANRTISHADTSSQGSVNNSGRVYVQDITLDTYGHVTAIGSTTVPDDSIGVGQTWQAVTRTANVTYQNTTGKPIMVAGETRWQNSSGFEVSTNGSTWLEVLDSSGNDVSNPFSIIIPNNYYYRIKGTIVLVRELR